MEADRLASERRAFEVWARDEMLLNITRTHDGRQYDWGSTEYAWLGWLARSAIPIVVSEEMVGVPYRIVETEDGFEPQMRYTAGAVNGEFWFPLNSLGYWLEPEAFSHGNPKLRNHMPSREEAARALERARIINADEPIIRCAALTASSERGG